MASVFTRIMNGELPGRFVWRDERAVGFLTVAPLKPGHTLVVPVQEVEHWLDLDPELLAHLFEVARRIGRAIERAFAPRRVGLAVVGIEVPHVHLHVTPLWGVGDLDFSRADANPTPESLDDAADRIRAALREAGHPEVSE